MSIISSISAHFEIDRVIFVPPKKGREGKLDQIHLSDIPRLNLNKGKQSEGLFVDYRITENGSIIDHGKCVLKSRDMGQILSKVQLDKLSCIFSEKDNYLINNRPDIFGVEFKSGNQIVPGDPMFHENAGNFVEKILNARAGDRAFLPYIERSNERDNSPIFSENHEQINGTLMKNEDFQYFQAFLSHYYADELIRHRMPYLNLLVSNIRDLGCEVDRFSEPDIPNLRVCAVGMIKETDQNHHIRNVATRIIPLNTIASIFSSLLYSNLFLVKYPGLDATNYSLPEISVIRNDPSGFMFRRGISINDYNIDDPLVG